jgi:hypothetical protein
MFRAFGLFSQLLRQLLGLLFSLLPVCVMAAAAGSPATAVHYAGPPLAFEHNAGQSDPSVRFLARGPGYKAFLTTTGAVLAFDGDDGLSVMKMHFEGAAPSPVVTGADPMPHKTWYIRDPGGRSLEVESVARVRYTSIYPGIDLVYYGNEGRLEYDLVVAPQADPDQIRLQFDGAMRLSKTDTGDLLLGVGDRQFAFSKPYAY